MKVEIKIFFASVFLVLGISFFIFNFQYNGITGLAIGEESKEEISEETIVINITEDIALESINEAEAIIDEMIENNFSILFVNDTLLDAKRELERARYKEILKNPNSKKNETSEAREALRLLDLEKISFSNVLIYTDKIRERKREAFDIFDSISASKIKIQDYERQGIYVEESKELLEKSNTAFYEERYEDSEILLEQVRDNLETKITQAATLNTLATSAQNFIQRYWHYVLVFLILLSIIGFFFYKKISKEILKKKIKKLKVEKETLLNLMKKTQEERFKEQKISGIIYNIRMKKYQERMGKIKEILPVLEKKI